MMNEKHITMMDPARPNCDTTVIGMSLVPTLKLLARIPEVIIKASRMGTR